MHAVLTTLLEVAMGLRHLHANQIVHAVGFVSLGRNVHTEY